MRCLKYTNQFIKRFFQIVMIQCKMTLSLLIIMVLLIDQQRAQMPNVTIVNRQLLNKIGDQVVIESGVLNRIYDDSTYNQILNCKNGELNIINNKNGSSLIISYQGLPSPKLLDFIVHIQPNKQPKPTINVTGVNTFTVDFHCPSNPSDNDYFNKVGIQLTPTYRFSFLLDCDPNYGHKTFEMGYLIIAAFNAGILISVAIHSKIYSLKWKGKKLRFYLRWFHAIVFPLTILILVAGFYFFASKNLDYAFKALRYTGIGISAPFLFICFNQPFFLRRQLRLNLCKKLRYCDFLSFTLTIAIVILSVFFENWILYDFIAICICVASIKLFHFRSLKEAFIFMGIFMLTVTIVSIVFNVIFSQSYNDYATQLSSPLFFSVPGFIKNLYKQCSWLPVIDIIIPGSTLAYLRLYDENRSSKCGGIYTICGNLTFVASTVLWIGIQTAYPYGVPFSLVTYSCLMLVILLFAWKRKELGTIFRGNFYQDTSVVEKEKMHENRQSFSRLVAEDIIEPLKKQKISQGSQRNSFKETK